jgi:hypothetical protein
MRTNRKTLSDFDAERLVMEMVYDYEHSSLFQEARLAEIKGWRKALALGAAGLAGLSPMKAHAGNWPGDVPGGIDVPSSQMAQDLGAKQTVSPATTSSAYDQGKAVGLGVKDASELTDRHARDLASKAAYKAGLTKRSEVNAYEDEWVKGFIRKKNNNLKKIKN